MALAEAARLQGEAEKWKVEYGNEKRAGVKKMIITGALCFMGGLVCGIGSVFIVGGN
jgi:hypothetical protein